MALPPAGLPAIALATAGSARHAPLARASFRLPQALGQVRGNSCIGSGPGCGISLSLILHLRPLRVRIVRLPFTGGILPYLPIKRHNLALYPPPFTRLLTYTQKMCRHSGTMNPLGSFVRCWACSRFHLSAIASATADVRCFVLLSPCRSIARGAATALTRRSSQRSHGLPSVALAKEGLHTMFSIFHLRPLRARIARLPFTGGILPYLPIKRHNLTLFPVPFTRLLTS